MILNEESVNLNNTAEESGKYSSEGKIRIDRYPSATTMLEISKIEYDKERERTGNLDNKASFFISAIIAIITIYIPIIPSAQIKQIYIGSSVTLIILVTICICILAGTLIVLIIAFYNLYKSFSLKPYNRVNFENLNNEQLLLLDQNTVERGLLDHYNTILTNNSKMNNNKADKLNIGIKYSIIFFIMLSVTSTCLLIITG